MFCKRYCHELSRNQGFSKKVSNASTLRGMGGKLFALLFLMIDDIFIEVPMSSFSGLIFLLQISVGARVDFSVSLFIFASIFVSSISAKLLR